MKPTSTKPRPLVQWINRNTAPHGRELDPDSPIGAIATSVIGAAHLGSTLAAARADGRGALVDTEAWRSQLEPEDPQRGGEFRRLRLELDPARSLRPSHDTLAESDRLQLLVAHRNAQVSLGASILLSPYHRVREEAPLSSGRRLDLDLAHEFGALVAATGATEAPGVAGRRSIAIGIAVDARRLSPAVITELIAGYRDVSADLFWIWVWKFTSSAVQYEQVQALAGGLQLATGIPCLLGGIGRLWEAALRNGVAAACQGWGRTEMHFPPRDPPQSLMGNDDDDGGLGIHVFHRAIRGTTNLGREAETPLRQLFAEVPCECGHHTAAAMPESQPERHAHNRACAEQLTSEIAALGTEQASGELPEIVAVAEAHRERLELGALPRGWHAAAETTVAAEQVPLPVDLWLRQTG